MFALSALRVGWGAVCARSFASRCILRLLERDDVCAVLVPTDVAGVVIVFGPAALRLVTDQPACSRMGIVAPSAYRGALAGSSGLRFLAVPCVLASLSTLLPSLLHPRLTDDQPPVQRAVEPLLAGVELALRQQRIEQDSPPGCNER